MKNCTLIITDKNGKKTYKYNVSVDEQTNKLIKSKGGNVLSLNTRKDLNALLKNLKSNTSLIKQMYKGANIIDITNDDKLTIINKLLGSDFISDPNIIDRFKEIPIYYIDDSQNRFIIDPLNLYGKNCIVISKQTYSILTENIDNDSIRLEIIDSLLNALTGFASIEDKKQFISDSYKTKYEQVVLKKELNESIVYKSILSNNIQEYKHVFEFQIPYYDKSIQNKDRNYKIGDWIQLNNGLSGIYIGNYNQKDLILIKNNVSDYTLYYIDDNNFSYYNPVNIELSFKPKTKSFNSVKNYTSVQIKSNYNRIINDNDILIDKDNNQYIILKIEFNNNEFSYVIQDTKGNIFVKKFNDLINEKFQIIEDNSQHINELPDSINDVITTIEYNEYNPMMHDLIKFIQGNDIIVTKQNKEYVISKVINYKTFIVIDNDTNSFIKINPEDISLIKLHRAVNITRDTKSLSTPFTKVLQNKNNYLADEFALLNGYKSIKQGKDSFRFYKTIKGVRYMIYDTMNYELSTERRDLKIGDFIVEDIDLDVEEKVNFRSTSKVTNKYKFKRFHKIINIVTIDGKKHYFTESLFNGKHIIKDIVLEDDSTYEYYVKEKKSEQTVTQPYHKEPSPAECDRILTNHLSKLCGGIPVSYVDQDNGKYAWTDGKEIFINIHYKKDEDQSYIAQQATHELIHIVLSILRFYDQDLYVVLLNSVKGNNVIEKEENIVNAWLKTINKTISINKSNETLDNILIDDSKLYQLIKKSFRMLFDSNEFLTEFNKENWFESIQSNLARFSSYIYSGNFENYMIGQYRSLSKKINSFDNIKYKCE